MNKLFNFEYQTENIKNKDLSDSRFAIVYGQEGKVVHTKKDAYQIIPTHSICNLGETFLDKGYHVTSFTHKYGESIGLNITLGSKPTEIGEKRFNAYITVPNNGSGKGHLSLKEVRLVCTNGMVRTLSQKKNLIKIPHNLNYFQSIELMKQSLIQFDEIQRITTEKDIIMNNNDINHNDFMYLLNLWFYQHELPIQHQKQLPIDEFRRLLAVDPENVPFYSRYESLLKAFNREKEYNDALNLKLSKYTVFATISNYLTRVNERSASSAPKEIQEQRFSKKLEDFELILLER
jgi:hypothetical protein